MPTLAYQEYLDALPSEWQQIRLGDLGEVHAGSTPRRSEPKYWGGDIPWLTPSEVTGQADKWVGKTDEYITDEGYDSTSVHLVPEGSLLVTTRATIGEVVIADVPITTNQGFKNLVLGSDDVPLFYYYVLRFVADEMERLAGGSTFDEISKSDFVEIVVPRPSPEEQRRIADVLDTVDAAIQETDNVVDKQEQVKTALLQDLLTRGLDVNGRLRDPEREPEAFRETRYGPLPETWEMKPLKDFAAGGSNTFGNGPFGSNLLTSEMTHEGIPVVYIADIEEGRYRRETDRHVTPEKAQELSGFDVRKGDVIMSKVGDPPCDAAPYLRDQFAIMTQDVIRIRPAEDVDTQFLTDLLNSKVGRKAVNGISVQGTRKRVSLTDLKTIQLPKPPQEEQLRIGKVVATKREKMEEERKYRDKLQHFKVGLMQDLLTGQVRLPEAEFRVDEVVA